MAKTHGGGASVFGDRPGLEFDGLGSERMVLPDCLRNVYIAESRFPLAGSGFLPANGSKCCRHAGDHLGFGRNGWGSYSDRPAGMAPDHCLGRKIQVRTSGKRARPTLTGPRSAKKFPPGLAYGPHVRRSGARAPGSAFCPEMGTASRRRSAESAGSVAF